MKVTKQTQQRTRLVAEGLALWGEQVFKKWGQKCEICSKPATRPHHFIPRSRCSLLQFDIENGVPLCYFHHAVIHQTGDPRIPQRIIEKRGSGWADYIFSKANEQGIQSNTIKWIKSEIERLEEV